MHQRRYDRLTKVLIQFCPYRPGKTHGLGKKKRFCQPILHTAQNGLPLSPTQLEHGSQLSYVDYPPKVPYEKLPQQKEALEARLAQLLEAQPDFEAFSKTLTVIEQSIRTICSAPSSHQRPSFFSFEKDPLKQALTQETVSKITALVRELGARELALVKKWPLAYPESKQKTFSRFDWNCPTETAAQNRLNAFHYDIKADIEQCKKHIAFTLRKLEEPARAKASRERKEARKARISGLLNQPLYAVQ